MLGSLDLLAIERDPAERLAGRGRVEPWLLSLVARRPHLTA